MSLLRRVYMWLVAILRPDRLENDLDREMRFHLDMEIEANVRRGMSPGEAHRVAMIAFGGVERHKESARDERGTRFIGGAVTDMRFALRRLRTHRGFSFLVTGTLAIGIGATTAVYSYANWVLYRPVPGVVAPDELVTVSFEDGPGQPTGISYPRLWRSATCLPSRVSRQRLPDPDTRLAARARARARSLVPWSPAITSACSASGRRPDVCSRPRSSRRRVVLVRPSSARRSPHRCSARATTLSESPSE